MAEGYGYKHNENDGIKRCANLTQKEKAMVIRVNSAWREKMLPGADGKSVSRMTMYVM